MEKETLLYRFFSGQLSAEERLQFDELVATDTEFATQFEFERNLQKVVTAPKNQALKAQLKGFEKEIATTSIHHKLPRKRYTNWAIAASIVLLVGASWFGYRSFTGVDYNNLYQENFETYPNTAYTITRSQENISIKRKAFAAYETGNYKIALDYFKTLSDSEELDYIDFYAALSHLNIGDSKSAIPFLEKTIAGNSNYVAEAHWYIVLAYLKQEKRKKALLYLKELGNTYSYKNKEAKALLKELE